MSLLSQIQTIGRMLDHRFVNRQGSTMTGKLDVGATIRSTGETVPTSGAGIELEYVGNTGYVIAYDRTGTAFKLMRLWASSINILPVGGTVTLGDGGTTNYTQFAANGSQSFAGTARIEWTKITAASDTTAN